MQINKVTSYATKAVRKVGETITSNKPNGATLRKGLSKINNFVQGEGYNPGRGAYYTLISAFVVAPRLLQAREPDEFREILTRDIVTILTILFAMKGLKSGMCAAAQKKAGLPLVKDLVGKDASKLKRLGGYLNPEGGIIALNSEEILTRYSRLKDKDSLIKTLDLIDKEGGNISKVFQIEKKQGLVSAIKNMIKPAKEGAEKTPLLNAAKKMFGEDFTSKSNAELIDAIKNIAPDNKVALEGLEEVIGTKGALGEEAVKLAGDKVKKGILNSKNNPITYYARNIASNFETISLGLTAGFLGFGLPKINEKMTMKRHMNQPQSSQGRAESPISLQPAQGQIFKNLNGRKEEMKAFQSFMGNA